MPALFALPPPVLPALHARARARARALARALVLLPAADVLLPGARSANLVVWACGVRVPVGQTMTMARSPSGDHDMADGGMSVDNW